MTSFCDLSAELILIVLMELESPFDVRSFILTSKAISQIFRVHKVSVLSSVLCNAVNPDVLIDLIAANRSYSVCSLSSRQDYVEGVSGSSRDRLRTDEYRQRRIQRVEDHFESVLEVEIHDDLRNIDTLQSMWKLWILIEGFVDHFATVALRRLELAYFHATVPSKVDSERDKIAFLGPSSVERSRIFRAFCRFEEYRRLYGGPDHVCQRRRVRLTRLAQEPFRRRYTSWEILEIRSVHTYLVDRMTALVNELEDMMLSKLTENVIEGEPGEMQCLQRRKYFIMNMFEHDHDQRRQIRFMVELGLPFLSHLSTANFEQRLMAMTNFTNERCAPALDIALGHFTSPKYAATDSLRLSQGDFGTDQLRQRNPGRELFTSPNERPLERAGIIFWDQTRLNSITQVQTDYINNAFRHAYTPNIEADEDPLTHYKHRPFISERIEGSVNNNVLEELELTTPFLHVDRLFSFLDDLEY